MPSEKAGRNPGRHHGNSLRKRKHGSDVRSARILLPTSNHPSRSVYSWGDHWTSLNSSSSIFKMGINSGTHGWITVKLKWVRTRHLEEHLAGHQFCINARRCLYWPACLSDASISLCILPLELVLLVLGNNIYAVHKVVFSTCWQQSLAERTSPAWLQNKIQIDGVFLRKRWIFKQRSCTSMCCYGQNDGKCARTGGAAHTEKWDESKARQQRERERDVLTEW